MHARESDRVYPLWTGATGGTISFSSPAVVNGVVYVGSDDGKLYAFDASGSMGCTPGSPTTCDPLWTGATGASVASSSPAVVNGVVYVGSDDGKLYAFDASGTTGCSGGIPKTCAPLWTGATTDFVESSPAVANGIVYVGSDDKKLYAFSASGTTGCSGSPKHCTPLWTGLTGDSIFSSPAVAGGVVYVGSGDHSLYAFEASGATGCSGTPRKCAPLWTGATGDFVSSSPAVADGVVYVGSGDHKLYAFDASGTAGCSGSPKKCAALCTGVTGDFISSSPAVADGVVYIRSADNDVHAFGGTFVTRPTKRFQTATGFDIAWVTTGKLVSSFDVRFRKAPFNGGFGAFQRLLSNSAEMSTQFTGAPGNTYCF